MATKQTRLTPFGRKVRKRLIDKNMTQVELAALLGCNKQYIHKILVGERSGKKYIEAISRMPSCTHTSTTFSFCQTLQNRRKAFLMTSRQSLRTMQTLSWTLAP